MAFEIIRTDREDSSEEQVAHDLSYTLAKGIADDLNRAPYHFIVVLGTEIERYAYRVQEQGR